MARPTKQGVDYFPLDVQFDEKIELLILEKGDSAVSVLVTLWQLIYQNEGYYIDYSPDLLLLIKKRVMICTDKSGGIIEAAVKRDIFNKDLLDRYSILTSRAIQKRYFIAARKKIGVSVVRNYLCEGVSAADNCSFRQVSGVGNATKEEVEVKEEVDTVAEKNTRYLPIAEKLREIVLLRRKQNITPSNIKSWANTIRLMIEKDKVELSELENVLDWYHLHWNDNQYIPVVESADSLRKKYGKLIEAIKRETTSLVPQRNKPRSTKEEYAMELINTL